MTSTTKELYTVSEAAELLSISESTMRKLHRAGEISFVEISRKCVRVRADEIRKFAESRRSF